MKVTDGQLVEQARAGDKMAFGDLVDRYRDMVYGLGYHLTGNFEDARDLAQEAFVQGYLKLSQLHEPGKFSSWLRQIALNVHRMRRRSPAPITLPLDEEIEMKPRHEPSEIETVVQEALAKLREPERLALTLHYINGYTQSEIGGFLGVQPATVKTRLARARQHLRKEIMAMVEDTFDKNKLPAEFRENVIQAVNVLMGSIRAVFPEDPSEILANILPERNEKWRAILAKIPPELLPKPLKEQGQAPKIAVSDLSEDLQEEVRNALYITWIWFGWYRIYLAVSNLRPLPWVKDFDNTWVQFYQSREGGKWRVWLADVPGNSGTLFLGIPIDPEDVKEKQKPLASEQDNLDFVSHYPLPDELHKALLQLRQALDKATGSLRGDLYAGMADLMHQARKLLPPNILESMKTKRVSVRDLPESARELLRKACSMHWATYVLEWLERVQHSPSWFRRFDDVKLEFGLYPCIEGAYEWEKWANTEYVIIHAMAGENDGLQIGISKQLDVSRKEEKIE